MWVGYLDWILTLKTLLSKVSCKIHLYITFFFFSICKCTFLALFKVNTKIKVYYSNMI